MRRAVLWTGLVASPVMAADAAVTVSLMQWFGSSLLVIVLILALAWMLKKSRLVPDMAPGQLRVISMLPLGNKERLLVVKVGEQQLLLGMTPNQINLLCQLEQPLPENSVTVPFAQQLNRWIRRQQDETATNAVVSAAVEAEQTASKGARDA